jgi:hypothetical protein
MASTGALIHVQEAFAELETLLKLKVDDRASSDAQHRSVGKVYSALTNALEVRGKLVLSLTENGFTFQGQMLHQRNDIRGQAFHRLFHEGVRELTVEPGFSVQELRVFLDLIAMPTNAQNVVQGSLATAIWKAALGGLRPEFRMRRRLLVEDDPDEMEDALRQLTRDVTAMVRREHSGHARLAEITASLFAEAQAPPPWPVAADETLRDFAKTVLNLINHDTEGEDVEVLQRSAITVAREALIAGEISALNSFFTDLDAPAEEGKRAQAIRRDRITTLLAGNCCDPGLVAMMEIRPDQLDALTVLLAGLGFDAVAPYLALCGSSDDRPLAIAIARGLGERLNSAAADMGAFVNSERAESVIPTFLAALTDLVPSAQMITVLEPLRDHPDKAIQDAAAELLSRAVKINNLREARHLLDSIDRTEFGAALRFFRQAHDERAAEELVNFLENIAPGTLEQPILHGAYRSLGAMRSHQGFAFLERTLTAKSLTGKYKSSTRAQICALHGLVATDDALTKKLLNQLRQEKRLPGPVKAALVRLLKEPG